MHAQHRPQRIRPPTAARLRIERLHHGFEGLPRNQPVHLLQKKLATRPPLLRVVLQFRESRLFHDYLIVSPSIPLLCDNRLDQRFPNTSPHPMLLVRKHDPECSAS